MNAGELAGAAAAPVQVPVALGAEGIAYHAITDGSGPLRLTGPVIAGSSSARSPGGTTPPSPPSTPASAPGADITVVHRSDGSGTTYIFSNYLSSVSPAWAAQSAPAGP